MSSRNVHTSTCCILCLEFLSDARRSPREGYADLKRCLLIPRLVIFDSRVCRGIPSRVAAPDGPEIWPQVRPTHARGRDRDNGIRRLDDGWRFALLEAHVVWAVENSSTHGSPL